MMQGPKDAPAKALVWKQSRTGGVNSGAGTGTPGTSSSGCFFGSMFGGLPNRGGLTPQRGMQTGNELRPDRVGCWGLCCADGSGDFFVDNGWA